MACCAWNVPSLPVKPCTSSACFLIDQYAHLFLPPASPLSPPRLACPSATVKLKPDSVRILRPSSTLVPSMRTTIGTLMFRSRAAATTPVASVSQRRMPPKMLISTAFTFVSESRMRNAFLTCSALAPPPTSRKLAGTAARVLDDVHGGHRQARAVHHAADVAVELDVVQAELRGFHFERILFVQIAQLDQILVAEQRVVVEVDLGVERVDLAVLRQDERIDLGQRGVESSM